MDNTLKQLLEEVYRLTMENEQLRQQMKSVMESIRPPKGSVLPDEDLEAMMKP